VKSDRFFLGSYNFNIYQYISMILATRNSLCSNSTFLCSFFCAIFVWVCAGSRFEMYMALSFLEEINKLFMSFRDQLNGVKSTFNIRTWHGRTTQNSLLSSRESSGIFFDVPRSHQGNMGIE
jgi:hypothetical protein